MKYVVLIYGNPKNWEAPLFLQYEEHSPEERKRIVDEFINYQKQMHATMHIEGGVALDAPEKAVHVTERGGIVSITDGPYAEAKEQLAGFILVESGTIDDAIDIARHFPDIKYSGVEIRPVLSLEDADWTWIPGGAQ